jgi:gliding motility-associated protein GldM
MAGNHMSEMSPRQRMINMMYLVLTALLAMNISKEVLDAFKTMDNSIGYSYVEKLDSNNKQYGSFRLKSANNPEKLEEWNNVAMELQSQSEELIIVINSIRDKFEFESRTDKKTPETAFEDDLDKNVLKQKDNKELTHKILVKSKEKNGFGLGLVLKEARETYKEFLLRLDTLEIDGNIVSIYEGSSPVDSIREAERKEMLALINYLFNTSPPPTVTGKGQVSWEEGKYMKQIPQAVLALMGQDKLDVANIEGTILDLLQQKTGQSAITINAQMGVVSSPRHSIMLGDSFNAKVFIAGVDTNQLPIFNLYSYSKDGERLSNDVKDTLRGTNGEGIFSTKPKKAGTYWLGGDIIVQTEEGPDSIPFKQQYRVDEAMSVISPDKMNVLYTQVKNPVSISVPGYSSDELNLYSDFSGCNIKWKKNGTYELFISKRQSGKNARKTINLFIKHKKSGKLVGKKITFRIKNVPPPVPSIRKVTSGELSLLQLKTSKGIQARLDNFDFDLEYEITSYRFRYPSNIGTIQNFESKGGKFGEVKSAFDALKRGQLVSFDNIYYKIKNTDSKPQKLDIAIQITIK